MLSIAFASLLSYPFLLLRVTNPAGSFPKALSEARERECLERAAAGDQEARNTLIEHNLRLVAHIVKKYYTRTRDQDDLISIGTIGLIKGISTYKPDKGVRLATYASRCIENEILMFFRSQRKSAGDLSLSDSIDADGDGGNPGGLRAAAVFCGERPGAPGTAGGDAALRSSGRAAPDPEADGGEAGHLPLLYLPHREKGAG